MRADTNSTTDTFVDDCVSRCIEDALDSLRVDLTDAASCDPEKDESPLEAAFFRCWSVMDQRMESGCIDVRMFSLTPQVEAHGYRIDFVVTPEKPMRGFKFAIELDGHEFHERTKEQATRRNRRDRELAAAGWTVVHVSGSELYRQPYETVSEIWEQAHGAWIDACAAEYCRRA